jgi:hypothetical protein
VMMFPFCVNVFNLSSCALLRNSIPADLYEASIRMAAPLKYLFGWCCPFQGCLSVVTLYTCGALERLFNSSVSEQQNAGTLQIVLRDILLPTRCSFPGQGGPANQIPNLPLPVKYGVIIVSTFYLMVYPFIRNTLKGRHDRRAEG